MKLTPKVIFEDNSILVLDKPSGLVVNRAETTKELTVQDWLEGYLKLKDRGIGERAGIVHRLDKETSGLLLVAKTQAAFENLQGQFKQRRVKKKYLALVHGKVEPKQGIIKAPISRSPFNRKKFGVFLGGREAETKYKVLSIKYKGENFYNLLELEPKTGRTHQIRIHLKHINYPVVGDELYAGRKTARQDRYWCPRQFLHASFLCFIHPEGGQKIVFISPLPEDLKQALSKL